jgi:hypothetical protein
MNWSLDLCMITNQRLLAPTRHSPELSAPSRHSSYFGHPQVLISTILATLKNKSTCDIHEIMVQNSTKTQDNSCKAKQYYPYTDYPSTILRLQGRINQV